MRAHYRVTGATTTFQGLVDTLGAAKGVKYSVHYRDPAEAAAEEERARLNGDALGELMWSIRPLIASGYGVADGAPESMLDIAQFDFEPESVEKTFKRLYG